MECYYFFEKGDRFGFIFFVVFVFMLFFVWNVYMMVIVFVVMLRLWVDVLRLGKVKQNYRCYLDLCQFYGVIMLRLDFFFSLFIM